MTSHFLELFDRDLNRLINEINSFDHEENLWKVTNGITNSSANLALHLCGNLRHFLAKELGGFDYERDRDFEFSGSGHSKKTILEEVELTQKQVYLSLEGIENNLLAKEYPIQHFGKPMTYAYFLIHLYGHLNYHLGQINYLRRMIES